MNDVTNPLLAWESYYIIVGSVAGALIGLQFVVLALVAERPRQTSTREIAAFGTPTVLHFCAALLVSALLSAPWSSLAPAGLALSVLGAAGIVYSGIVIRRARRTKQYEPQWEDWLWHAALPLVAYTSLLIASLSFAYHPGGPLAIVATASLGLVFIGIHNAWDTIIYVAVDRRNAERTSPPGE